MRRFCNLQRLAFFPCMAPFILSFGDLNRHMLRQEPTGDPYQRMLDAHTFPSCATAASSTSSSSRGTR